MLDVVLRICECCARFCASDLRILCSILCFGFANFVFDFVLRICGFCARPCADFKLFFGAVPWIFGLCFGFANFVLDFVLRICEFCARFCASDLRILCSILCFGFADFVFDFVLRICEFCASDLRMLCSILCFGFAILCSILCFGFANFVLDFVFRICECCARFCASDLRILCSILCFGFADCAKSCARRNPTGRNQEHEKPGFGVREIRKFSLQLRLRKSKFWCSRPVVLVLPALGSGAPAPWFRCSRPLAQAPGRARKWFLGLFVIWLLNVESSS